MSQFELSKHLKNIQPSPIRAFNDRISGIEGIIRLTIGEPDFPTPTVAKEAAIEAINNDLNGYTHSAGLMELRETISVYLERKYKVNYDASTEILVTHGATEALFASLFAVLNPGDKVITPTPSYVIYQTQVRLAGGEFIPVDVSDDGFKLTPERLKQVLAEHPDTKVIIFNYPSNPLGVTYHGDELEALAKIFKEHGLIVVSDEIYAELTYDTTHVSMGELLPDQTILINGTAKSHSMTGWRSGFIASRAEFISEIFKVHQSCINTPNTQMQYASIAAYNDGDKDIAEMKATYYKRRNYLMDRFADLGFNTSDPEGAFYLFVQVPEWYQGDDFDFCLAMANDAKVGCVPGSGFGEAGKNWFRVSYAASMESLEEAMDRIEKFVKENN